MNVRYPLMPRGTNVVTYGKLRVMDRCFKNLYKTIPISICNTNINAPSFMRFCAPVIDKAAVARNEHGKYCISLNGSKKKEQRSRLHRIVLFQQAVI